MDPPEMSIDSKKIVRLFVISSSLHAYFDVNPIIFVFICDEEPYNIIFVMQNWELHVTEMKAPRHANLQSMSQEMRKP